MPRLLFDYEALNLDIEKPMLGNDVIESINPHRHEFRILDSVLYINKEDLSAVGYFEVKEDQFWCRGHIPGRPIFPGVLQIECAAQLSSVLGKHTGLIPDEKFFGLAGFDKIKYRRQVVPGDNLYILGRAKSSGRISTFEFQTVCNGKIVNQGEISGTIF